MPARRAFNVIRRVSQLVDMAIPFQQGITGYRLQAATNFDATFNTVLEAPPSGWLDSSVDRRVLTSIPNRDLVRIVWNPNSYSGAPWNLSDNAHIWVKVATMNGAVVVEESPIGLILSPYDRIGKPQITIAGTAPTAATPAAALRLDLPMGFRNIQVFNKGSNPLLISTDPDGGPEVELASGSAGDYTLFGGCQDTLRVRGNTAFSATLVVPFIE